jgi:hypothetical protein
MTNFLKLTSIIINTSNISKIEIKNNKYEIHLNNNKVEGFIFFSKNDIIEICKNKDPLDYSIITEWINDINN